MITTFLDCLFMTSFLILEKSEITLYIYGNILLVCTLILDCYLLYLNRRMQESIKTLNKTSTIIRFYILICSIFVSLRLDKIINWEWSAVLWALWFGLFCSIAISIGCLILTFNKLV